MNKGSSGSVGRYQRWLARKNRDYYRKLVTEQKDYLRNEERLLKANKLDK
jgi:hypothetical protein